MVLLLDFFMQTNDLTVDPIRRNGKEFVNNSLQTKICLLVRLETKCTVLRDGFLVTPLEANYTGFEKSKFLTKLFAI